MIQWRVWGYQRHALVHFDPGSRLEKIPLKLSLDEVSLHKFRNVLDLFGDLWHLGKEKSVFRPSGIFPPNPIQRKFQDYVSIFYDEPVYGWHREGLGVLKTRSGTLLILAQGLKRSLSGSVSKEFKSGSLDKCLQNILHFASLGPTFYFLLPLERGELNSTYYGNPLRAFKYSYAINHLRGVVCTIVFWALGYRFWVIPLT